MPNVDLYNIEGTPVGEIYLDDGVFGIEINKAVLYQVVKMQLANKRQGTQSALTRAEVRGGEENPGGRREPDGQDMAVSAPLYGSRAALHCAKAKGLFIYTA